MDVRDSRLRSSPSSSSGNSSIGALISHFGLQFPKDSTEFFAGDMVTGGVLITLQSSVVIRRIRVCVECRVKMKPQLRMSGSAQTTNSLSASVEHDEERVIFSRSCTPFGDELDYVHHFNKDNFMLRFGNYEFIFEIPLPIALPPSVANSPDFEVSYLCTACVEYGPHFERAAAVSRPLSVLKPLDLAELPDPAWRKPCNLKKTIDLSHFFPAEVNNNGAVSVDVWLSHGGVAAGQKLAFSGLVSNESQLPVADVQAIVLQVIDRRGTRLSRTSSDSSRASVDTCDRAWEDGWSAQSPIATASLGAVPCNGRLAIDAQICVPADHTVVPPGPWMEEPLQCCYRFALKVAMRAAAEIHVVTLARPLAVGSSFSASHAASPLDDADDVFSL